MKTYIYTLLIACSANLFGCSNLLDVDDPKSLVSRDVVFSNDVTATTAVTGMYATIIGNTSNFASGSGLSVSALAGLSGGEFACFDRPSNALYMQFYNSQLLADNGLISNLWVTPYQIIYQANSAIEGLRSSETISASVKDQLLAESLFIRAFCHFYLVNMFGDVPLITSTDYRTNSSSARTSETDVYSSIVTDLTQAKILMSDVEQSPEHRVRPTKATVSAFLARVYLYLNDWEMAENEATEVIETPYLQLEPSLDDVFLSTSKEAIWQLRPTSRTINTWEGNTFILASTPSIYYLAPGLINSFEPDDARLTMWIRSVAGSNSLFYYPFKYKIRTGGPGSATPVALSEYSMVFRLAEQYLIRAEARSNLNQLQNATNDLNTIRARAQLPLLDSEGATTEELLLAVEKERVCELFGEWGHRWFDLKRTHRASDVLGGFKADWDVNDELYPIPATEFRRNPNLKIQNQGY